MAANQFRFAATNLLNNVELRLLLFGEVIKVLVLKRGINTHEN
jgi:hypothetical protein